jgi:hypothetical protein
VEPQVEQNEAEQLKDLAQEEYIKRNKARAAEILIV